MGFEQVVGEYARGTRKQIHRMKRQGRDFHTKAEQAALKFYTEAIQKIVAVGKEPDATNTNLRGQELEQLPVDTGHAEPGTPA